MLKKKTTLCNTGKKLKRFVCETGKTKKLSAFRKNESWGEKSPLYFESKKKEFEFKMVFRCKKSKGETIWKRNEIRPLILPKTSMRSHGEHQLWHVISEAHVSS